MKVLSMDTKKVIILPGNTEIGLEICKSLKDCKELILYSGASVPGHAPYVFKDHFYVPEIYNQGWIGHLNNILKEHKIDYIFPAYDDVIVALAENADKLVARIISSPISTCLITRSKTETYEKFNGLIAVPKQYKDISEVDVFPVFVKPDKGQGSQGAQRVDDMETLTVLLRNNPDLIVLENLSGKEFTIDCLTDRRRGLLYCSGRERIRVKSGISMNSKPVGKELNEIFCNFANIISKELIFHGAWFFQVKQDAMEDFKLLEIAPRISGTMATHRVLGVNFPLLSICEHEGIDFQVMTNDLEVEVDRALVNRYKSNIEYDKVYIDFDDTLIFKGKVNVKLVAFIYQEINRGSRVILITKNKDDLDSVLKKHRLKGLFDEIIWLKPEDSKSDYIDPEKAIFIDDSFSERKAVFEVHKIPTFDGSMLELLIDERI